MEPMFSAVSSDARHLYTLLQCIGFASRANVQITPDGIRFSVEDGRVIQGLAFLDKGLFTSYTFKKTTGFGGGALPEGRDGEEENSASDATPYPSFVISLSALLETLKIFGISEQSSVNSSSSRAVMGQNSAASSNAFTTPTLLLDRTCTLQYFQIGSPFSITLSEAGVKTTCELTTYEPDDWEEVDIPLQRDAIVMKIIMRSAWLYNAITELDATSPTILKLSASAKRAPFFSLASAGGPFSESAVEFSVDQHAHHQPGSSSASSNLVTTHDDLADTGTDRTHSKRTKLAPIVTETFLVSPPSSASIRIKQSYRFALIRKAMRAMAVASKVSIRGDRQGVMSLQFMIDLDEGVNSGTASALRGPGAVLDGKVTFVDFRFVPLIDDTEVEDCDAEDRDLE